MIAWLEAVLPFNPYIIDGFQTGDDYIYPWANAKAENTQTDDETYFVHRGQLDIFNFSRKPQGKSKIILENLKKAYKFRTDNEELITNGEFIPLKTKNEKVFAFIINGETEKLIVIGNLDFQNSTEKIIFKTNLNKITKFDIIHGDDNIKLSHKKLNTNLKAGEVKIIKVKG